MCRLTNPNCIFQPPPLLTRTYQINISPTPNHPKTRCQTTGCCSVTKSCPALWNPMDCSMPGFPVLHYVPDFAQIHVHWVSDAIWPSHPLLPPFPFAFHLSQYQGLFQPVSSLKQVTKILELQSFQWIFRVDFLSDWLVWSPCSPRDSQESSLAPQLKHQFFGTQLSLWSNFHICTWLLEKP